MNRDAPAGLVISDLTTQARCNGTYQKRAEEVNGVAAYQQLEDPDKWLCFCSNNTWTVQEAAKKGQNHGYLQTAEPHSVPWEGSTSWKEIHGGSDWRDAASIKVEVLSLQDIKKLQVGSLYLVTCLHRCCPLLPP